MKTEQRFKKRLNSWRNLTSGSINRQIFGASATVGLLTGLVKLVSFVKEFVVAQQFGTGDELDAYLIALIIPSFIINVLIGTSFNAAFTPVYIEVLEQRGIKAAQQLFSGVLAYFLGLLTIVTILIIFGAPIYLPLIASGFSPEKLDLTINLIFQLSPLILISGIIYPCEAILNAEKKFALVSIIPIITPIISIILLLSMKSWGIFALSSGLIFSTMLTICIFGIVLYKKGIVLIPKWIDFDADIRKVFAQYKSIIAGALLICSATPIDQAMAAMLSPGSVSALNYGNRVIASPMSLITTALTAVMIPYCSKMFAVQDWNGIKNTLRHYLKLILLVTLPFSITLIVFSQPLIKFLFERGSFTIEDTILVSQIQIFYALQIPFYIGNILLLRIINSIQINKIFTWISGFNLILNIFCNYFFVQWLGIKGIALSTTCVYVFSFSCLFVFTTKYIKEKCVLQKIAQSN